MSLEALPRLSGETLACLKESAKVCADCAAILKHMEAGDRVAPAWKPDGTAITLDQAVRHIHEMRGRALSKATVAFVKERAGTSDRPNGSGCFFCARILAALSKDGFLRDWPQDSKDEQVKIPVEAQVAHLLVERGERAEWEEQK